MKTVRILGLASASLVAVFLLGQPAAAAAVHVHIQGFAFVPNPINIALGDTITWDNHDGATHTATDNNCPRANGPGPCEFDSFNLATGQSFVHTFNAANRYMYKCTIHNFMGTMHVNGANTFADLLIDRLAVVDVGNGLQQKRVEVTVKDNGNEWSPASQVRVVYTYQGQDVQIGLANVGELAIGGATNFAFLWNVNGKIGDFTVKATADNAGAVAESNENNNVRTLTVGLVVPAGVLPGTDVNDPL